MTHRPVIDAGPALNFFSINKERLLIAVLGPLSAPETVQDEVLRKAERDKARFGAAAGVWSKLGSKYMQVLSDDQTDALSQAVADVCGTPMIERLKDPKNLGEIMVIAHALVAAESGLTVTVLIDDGDGRKLAAAQRDRLKRLRDAGNQTVGQIQLIGTLTVLNWAAQKGQVKDKAEMRSIYDRLRALDDGLAPINDTKLLNDELWVKADTKGQ